jgi:Ca2+-binding EF-hand superfamily protein
MFNQQQRDKYIPELKGIVREQLVNEPGVLGFEKLGLKERPKSVGHGMKDWIDDSKHGVAKRLNAPIRADSRGHSKQVRDIVQPAPSMPWSLSDDQREFLRGATQQQIKFYQRITEGIYTSSGDNGQNIKASLHRMDRHNCGRISRKDFITVLRMVRSDLPKNDVQELAEKLDYYGDKTVDINKFISIFWKDQQKTPAGGKVHISTQHSMYKDQDDYHEYGVPSEPKTINRQQWLRELLKERSGGKRSTYKLVEKVLKHFKEATWKGQDQILYTLRAGDRRRTGAMREQEFRKAMKIIGLYLTEDEYIELFDLFDKDKSGDVTFDELVELLDEEHCGGAVNQPTVKNYTSNIDEPRDNRYSAARDGYDDRRNQPRDNQRSARDGYDDRRNQPRDNQRSARDDYDDRQNGYRRNDQGTYQNYDEPPKNERYIQEQKRRELLRNNPSATYKAFRNLRQRLNEQFPIVDRSRLMRAMDLNRNGEIDRREFTQGLKNLGIHIPESEATALYKCLDSDRSGSVDMEEICILLDV